MRQYLEAVKTVLDTGTRKSNRTGVDTLSTFGVHYNIDLAQGFPLLTTKAINWKNIVVEMLWFLSGQTHIGILKQHGCKFWDAWVNEKTGLVPSAYGNFWRQFPVHHDLPFSPAADGIGVRETVADYNDQIAWLIDTLKRDPMSRRMVVSAWAPGNAQTSKLPPCHCLFVVNVQNMRPVCTCGGRSILPTADWGDPRLHRQGCVEVTYTLVDAPVAPRLCLHLTQRSCDIALGVPYNIASYALLAHLLSRFSGIPVGTFSHTLVDAHAYTSKADGSMAEYDHVPGLREQLTRQVRPLPKLVIGDEIKSLADVEALMRPEVSTEEVMRHFVLEGYDPHPAIPFKVAV